MIKLSLEQLFGTKINFLDVCTGNLTEIRKIYFNVAYLSEQLKDVTELQAVVDTIWGAFSAEYGGVYKFKLEFDDVNNRMIMYFIHRSVF